MQHAARATTALPLLPPRAAAALPVRAPGPRPVCAACRPAPPAAPGHGSASSAAGGERRRGCLAVAPPVRAKAEEGEAAGPAPTAKWGPALSPPFYLLCVLLIISAVKFLIA